MEMNANSNNLKNSKAPKMESSLIEKGVKQLLYIVSKCKQCLQIPRTVILTWKFGGSPQVQSHCIHFVGIYSTLIPPKGSTWERKLTKESKSLEQMKDLKIKLEITRLKTVQKAYTTTMTLAPEQFQTNTGAFIVRNRLK